MKFRCFSRVLEDVLILIITTLMYLIFFAGKSLQKYYEGRYLCNRGPDGINYEVICPRAVTITMYNAYYWYYHYSNLVIFRRLLNLGIESKQK